MRDLRGLRTAVRFRRGMSMGRAGRFQWTFRSSIHANKDSHKEGTVSQDAASHWNPRQICPLFAATDAAVIRD
jgi:hypothetical protein